MDYQSPTVECLGDSDMSSVMGAFVWAIGPVAVAVAVAVVLVLVISAIDITP